MAFEGYEALVVVAILVVVFLWGPQKLPELAKSIGQAKREFDKAAKEATSTLNTMTSTPPTSGQPQDPIIVAAKSLGIATEGKTKEELAKEIVQRSTK